MLSAMKMPNRGWFYSDETNGRGSPAYDPNAQRAEVLFRQSPEKALSNPTLASAEADPSSDRSLAIVAFATDQPERFISLVSCLPPTIQDIFFQYYLLGRTFSQIGALLFPNRAPNTQLKYVKTGRQIGLRALCVAIKMGGRLRKIKMSSSLKAKQRQIVRNMLTTGYAHPMTFQEFIRYPDLAGAYEEMLLELEDGKHSEISVSVPKPLGEFEVPANCDLSQIFVPSWSVLGPNTVDS